MELARLPRHLVHTSRRQPFQHLEGDGTKHVGGKGPGIFVDMLLLHSKLRRGSPSSHIFVSGLSGRSSFSYTFAGKALSSVSRSGSRISLGVKAASIAILASGREMEKF